MKRVIIIALLAIALFGQAREAGALSEVNLVGTYSFTFQATATDPTKLCGGSAACGGVNNVAGSLNQFYRTLGSDLLKGKCTDASSILVAGAKKISASGAKAGDIFYAAGTLISDGNSTFTDGQAVFSSTSPNSEALNYTDTGNQAIVCGGMDKSGECSSLCTTGSLNCPNIGGYGVTGTTATAVFYVYPLLAAGQCGPVSVAASLCCNDPSLVLVLHASLQLQNLNSSSVAQNLQGVVTDQAQSGTITAILQP
jgi:hypothetical protein